MRRTHAANTRLIFGIHGGGNIGLGLMANIISQADDKSQYAIIATSNDEFFNVLINANHQFLLRHPEDGTTSTINHVHMTPRTSDNIIALYTDAAILAICLTPIAFNESVEDITKGIINRFDKTGEKLTLLILMNLQDSELHVKEKIHAMLHHLISNPEKEAYILSNIDFVSTIPDRIVTKIDAAQIKQELTATLENAVPKDKKGTISTLVNSPMTEDSCAEITKLLKKHRVILPLYNAEKRFLLYAPESTSIALSHFSGITFTKEISLIETLKNKYINGPHTIIAWLGALVGCTTIAECIRYPNMKIYIQRLMNHEIGPTLKKAYPNITDSLLKIHQDLFFQRCEESYTDPVSRVGRNPLSKLDLFGRIIGTLSLKNKHSPGTHLPFLEMAIAAGITYALKNNDINDAGCNKIKQIFQENNQSYIAILCHQDESEHRGLNLTRDIALINRIIRNINLLQTTPELFLQIQPIIRSINIYANPIEIKKRAMMSILNTIGVSINLATGQMSYAENFTPFQLNFELVFIRHGETYGNAGFSTSDGKICEDSVKSGEKFHERRIFQGNIDKPINQLTNCGKQQAMHAAENLLSLGWIPDAVFHSPLMRAKETGGFFMELLKQHGVERDYIELPNIREMSFGAWENRRVCDMPAPHCCHSFYKNQDALVRESGENLYGEFHESENFYEVLLRAQNVLKSLNENYFGKKVLLFSHSMFGAACMILTGNGNLIENGDYLAFDGKKSDGTSYTIPNATPLFIQSKQKTILECVTHQGN